MLCQKCGAIVPEEIQYCQNCGNDMFAQTVAVSESGNEPTVAACFEEKTALEERTVAAGVQPAYQQPQPPKKKNKGVIIGIVVLSVIAVAAIVVAVLFGTGVIGKDEKDETSITAHQPAKKTNQGETAIQIGDIAVTEGQFDYYYYMSYQYFAQMESSYLQQGMSMGFPLDKAPDEVAYGKDDAGNDIMFDQAIADYAANLAYQQFALYNEAKAAGYTLTADEQKQIDDVFVSLEEQAEENGFSLDEFIKFGYSEKLDEEGLRELLEVELIASRYNEDLETKAYDSVTKEQVEAEYNANAKTYNYANIRYYSIALPTVTQADGELDEEFNKRKTEAYKPVTDEANVILNKVTDAESFKVAALNHKNANLREGVKPTDVDPTVENKNMTYNTFKTTVSEEAADWLFDAARKAGDKKVFVTEKAAYVVLVETPSFAGNNVDVRHCLIKFDVADGSYVSDSQKKAAYEEAVKVRDEWIKSGGTEDAFREIVKKYNDDTASNEKGGLYEGITPSSNYVDNFKNWAVDPARKAGDYEIVETSYGYHLMYFVKNNGYDWETTVLSKLQEEAYTNAFSALTGENGKYTKEVNHDIVDACAKKFCDKFRSRTYSYVNP